MEACVFLRRLPMHTFSESVEVVLIQELFWLGRCSLVWVKYVEHRKAINTLYMTTKHPRRKEAQ